MINQIRSQMAGSQVFQEIIKPETEFAEGHCILSGPDKRIGILNRNIAFIHERKFGILPG